MLVFKFWRITVWKTPFSELGLRTQKTYKVNGKQQYAYYLSLFRFTIGLE